MIAPFYGLVGLLKTVRSFDPHPAPAQHTPWRPSERVAHAGRQESCGRLASTGVPASRRWSSFRSIAQVRRLSQWQKGRPPTNDEGRKTKDEGPEQRQKVKGDLPAHQTKDEGRRTKASEARRIQCVAAGPGAKAKGKGQKVKTAVTGRGYQCVVACPRAGLRRYLSDSTGFTAGGRGDPPLRAVFFGGPGFIAAGTVNPTNPGRSGRPPCRPSANPRGSAGFIAGGRGDPPLRAVFAGYVGFIAARSNDRNEIQSVAADHRAGLQRCSAGGTAGTLQPDA